MDRLLLTLHVLLSLTQVHPLSRPGVEVEYDDTENFSLEGPALPEGLMVYQRPLFGEAADYKLDVMQETKARIKNNVVNLGERFQAFLSGNGTQYESFLVLLHSYVNVLSFTITSCASRVDFKIYYRVNSGFYTPNTLGQLLIESNTSAQHPSINYNVEGAEGGLYTIKVRPLNTSKIELYVRPLASELWTPLTVHKHRRGKKVTVRWTESILDPQRMQYCIELDLSSLCKTIGGDGAGPGNSPAVYNRPGLENSPYDRPAPDHTPDVYELQDGVRRRDIANKTDKDKIKCVGNRTSHTFYHLQQGQDYYITLYARHPKNNYTRFLYGATYLKYDRRLKPIGLRDDRTQVVNLRRHDGKVTLRYKVLEKFRPGPLEWYILPCGGTVLVEVRIRRRVVIARHQVSGYRHLTIVNPVPRQRYVLIITALDQDELNKLSGVEVLATMNPKSRNMFPDLPLNTKVKEYTSLRECTSVFIGWFPGPTTASMVRYCIKATEVSKRVSWALTPFETKPNQCGLDAKLKKSSREYSTMECLYVTPHDASFKKELKQKVSNLSPGRDYIIQVIMKKTHSRSLSYDLLRVSTVPTCD